MAGEPTLTEAERAAVKDQLDRMAKELDAVSDEALRTKLIARVPSLNVKIPSKETFRKARHSDTQKRTSGEQLVRVIEAFYPGWRLREGHTPVSTPTPLDERADSIPLRPLPIEFERGYAAYRAAGKIDSALERLARLYLPQYRGTPEQQEADALVRKSIEQAIARVNAVSGNADRPTDGRVATEIDHVPIVDVTADRTGRKGRWGSR